MMTLGFKELNVSTTTEKAITNYTRVYRCLRRRLER